MEWEFWFFILQFDKNAALNVKYLEPSKCIYEKSFFFSHSDLRNCADPKKTVNCTENWLRKDCGQLQDSKFQNYGCQLDDGKTGDYFECSNRNDKVDILFKNPPVPKQKSWQAVNYNEVVNFNNQSFFCGQQEISWVNFSQHWYSNENCLLKNGENVTISKLSLSLMTDYSFKMSPRLTEL